jgi:energy-coupling factor transporter transmembrane protein EcfT
VGEETGFRAAVERRSAVAVVFLHRLPRWVLLAAVFVLLVIGMAGTGLVAAAAFAVLALFLGWFAYLGWPRLDRNGRLLRIAGIALLIAFGVSQATGRL